MLKDLVAALLLTIYAGVCFAGDPLGEFEASVLKKGSAVATTGPVVYYLKESKKWGRATATLGEVKYDVRKTDSLVTPFIGSVAFEVTERISTYASEADARAAVRPKEKKEGALVHVFRLAYSYQGGIWRLTSGEENLQALAQYNNWRASVKFTDVASARRVGQVLGPIAVAWVP